MTLKRKIVRACKASSLWESPPVSIPHLYDTWEDEEERLVVQVWSRGAVYEVSAADEKRLVEKAAAKMKELDRVVS